MYSFTHYPPSCREIVRLVAQGYNNREIAQSLHIAEKMVKSYMNHILNQLDLRDRTQLAIASPKVGFPDI